MTALLGYLNVLLEYLCKYFLQLFKKNLAINVGVVTITYSYKSRDDGCKKMMTMSVCGHKFYYDQLQHIDLVKSGWPGSALESCSLSMYLLLDGLF